MRRDNYESGPSRRWLAVGFVLLALLLAFFVGRSTAPDPDEDQSRPPSASDTEAPIVEGQDESGAVAAAARLSQLMTGPTGDAQEYVDQMLAIAAPGWTDRAQELAENSVDFVTERYGEGGTIEFQPIRYRVESFAPDRSVIELWGVVLASGPKVGGIEESWITGTITLEWVGTEWKVSGQSSEGGPTPELLRTDEERTVDEILNDFQELPDAEE